MSGRIEAERILDAFLAPEADRLPDRVIDAALADIARSRQRRALRLPWRFPTMPVISRATGVAAVALVAIIGAGGLIYLNARAPGGVGGPGPTASPVPSPTGTAAGTAQPSVAPLGAWTPYSSQFYGFQMKYPPDWTVHSPATRAWQPADGTTATGTWPYADVFANPEAVDGDSIGLWVWEMPVGKGGDATTTEGLKAWAHAFCMATPANRDSGTTACDTFTDRAVSMCLDAAGNACRAAILVPDPEGPVAFFGDWGSEAPAIPPATVRIVNVGRPDDFAAAKRYGGSINLLTSFLATMNVGSR